MILALKWPFWPSICDFSPEVAVLALACPETVHLGPCMHDCVCVCVCVYFWSSDGDDEEREVERGWRLHGAYPQRGVSL